MTGSWRGKNPIQRNALIALAHFKDEAAIPELTRLIKEDPRPMIRGTAAWALGEIGTTEGHEVLKEALLIEEDEFVVSEITQAMELLHIN